MASADMSLDHKIDRRVGLLREFVKALSESRARPRSGEMDLEIIEQRKSHSWERAMPPLETGWYSIIQHVGVANGHAATFLRSVGRFDHVSTAALLARGCLESLALSLWLLGDTASLEERSLRGLADVRYSTGELKKLYRDDGSSVDPPSLDDRGREVNAALERIDRDAEAFGGDLPARLKYITLVDRLFDTSPDGAAADDKVASIYRYLSPLAHGTKWAVNHFATNTEDDELVAVAPTAEFIELVLFLMGIGYLRVGDLGRRRLAWADLAEHGAAEFIQLGPSTIDFG